MGLFGKKQAMPSWFIWLFVVVGLILALSEMGFLSLRGLTWGPVLIILIGLAHLLKK